MMSATFLHLIKGFIRYFYFVTIDFAVLPHRGDRVFEASSIGEFSMRTPLLRLLAVTVFLVSFHALAIAQTSADRVWTAVDENRLTSLSGERLVMPTAYKTYALNRGVVAAILDAAPEEFSHESRFTQAILTLPMPNGTFGRFRIEHSLIVEPGLLAKYPELGRTYNGRGIDDPTATVRLDFLPVRFSRDGAFDDRHRHGRSVRRR